MNLIFRQATEADLNRLIKMLSDDPLGSTREDNSEPLNQNYLIAFQEIDRDPNNELIVVESNAEIIGMLQLTFIPYLTYTGSWRCLIEGVRIHPDYRGQGLGTTLFEWAIARAKQKRCKILQHTSDKKRPAALAFYEKLGFKATHEGFKLIF